jgi:hypothetical protein
LTDAWIRNVLLVYVPLLFTIVSIQTFRRWHKMSVIRQRAAKLPVLFQSPVYVRTLGTGQHWHPVKSITMQLTLKEDLVVVMAPRAWIDAIFGLGWFMHPQDVRMSVLGRRELDSLTFGTPLWIVLHGVDAVGGKLDLAIPHSDAVSLALREHGVRPQGD